MPAPKKTGTVHRVMSNVKHVKKVTVRPVRRGSKDGVLSLRIDEATQKIIDRAAQVAGQSRTEFMVQSARQRAENVLLDQRLFVLNDEDWTRVNDALDNPPPPNAALKALLSRKAPWQK